MTKKQSFTRLASISLLLIAALLSSFLACSQPAPTAAPTAPSAPPKVLQVGVLLPLTGMGAAYGTGAKNGMDLVLSEFNNAGGFSVGTDKYTIQLLYEDDKYNPTMDKSSAEKLVFQDKVKFILGPIVTAGVLAVQPVTEANKVLLLCGGSAAKILTPDKQYTFRVVTTLGEFGNSFFEVLAAKFPTIKSCVSLNLDTETGWSDSAVLKAGAEKVGWQFTQLYFSPATSDFVPLLTGAIAKNPGCINVTGPVGQIGLMVKQARELGYKGLIWTHSPTSVEAASMAGGMANLEGFVSYGRDFSGPNAEPSLAAFYNKYIAKYGNWQDVAIPCSDWPMILAEAVNKAGSTDVDKVKAAFENNFGTYKDITSYTFTGMKTYGIGHQILYPGGVMQIQNGKSVSLAEMSVDQLAKAMGEK